MESHQALFAAVGAWIAQDPDATTQAALRQLLEAEDAAALSRLFAGRIAFGTAGLRAVMGPGPLQMNRLVVRQSALGILSVLRQEVPDVCQRGVVVGYDGRLLSQQMAHDAAGVLAAQGVHVHLFERAVPTPVAGFAIKSLRAAAGIVITASHNPKEYNGLKVFWHQAAQIVPPLDQRIAKEIDEVAKSQSVSVGTCWDVQQMKQAGRLSFLGEATHVAYRQAIRSLSQHRLQGQGKMLGIAYTPLHGVGAATAEAVLADAGFTEMHTVPSQRAPDGHFPTVAFPNPEEPGSMDAVLALAEAKGLALACANDPDADRLAVAARDGQGHLKQLTGDELGLLLADDALRQHGKSSDRGKLAQAAVGTTLVSARALQLLAKHYGAHYFETLTGFKWLAEQARGQAALGRTFLFAYEEALGYALGDVVWDKDGISALLAIAKLAAALHEKGQTLWHRLADISRLVGIAVSSQATVPLDAQAALAMMAELRAEPPQSVGPFAVVRLRDLTRVEDCQSLGLPQANVMVFELAAEGITHGRIIVRPSGTEPKVKCYYDILAQWPQKTDWGTTRDLALKLLQQLMAAHRTLLQKN